MSRLGKRQLHELYYYLTLTRRLEEEVARLHRQGKVSGPVCFISGLEAVSVGTAYGLSPHDLLSSSLPSVGAMLPRGVQPVEVFAHFMGKASAPSRGRDIAIQLGDFPRGLVAPVGHPATHLSVMAGVALGARMLPEPAVAVALMSAKSIATGDFHEGLNLAAVERLPLVVVVENDPASPGARLLTEGDYIYERTRGYGVPSLPVDGGDILQVLQVIETAINRARDGKGPTLVEARTSRLQGHALCEEAVPFPFPNAAGTREAKDPVQGFEAFLVEHGLLEPAERGLITSRIEQIIEADLTAAEENALPGAGTLAGGVFKETELSAPAWPERGARIR